MSPTRTAIGVCLIFLLVANSYCEIPDDFIEKSLELHNEYRDCHGVPPLQLRDDLNQEAQITANKLARRNNGLHHDRVGQNLYYIGGRQVEPADALKSWYGEGEGYDYTQEPSDLDAGHFTQMVWKDSQYVGIGVAQRRDKYYVCMDYDPPGNVETQYVDNVLEPDEDCDIDE